MTRLFTASYLFPCALLVWLRDNVAVAVLALWVAVSVAVLAYSLVSEWLEVVRARERTASLDAALAPLTERLDALEAAQKKTGERMDILLSATRQRAPSL